MAIRKTHATGTRALDLATALLQRARMTHPHKGVFEAADIQWAWRIPRLSDNSREAFWIDDHGPVAGILLTSSSNTDWQVVPVIVPGTDGTTVETVWNHALMYIRNHSSIDFNVPVSNDDPFFRRLAQETGFTAAAQDFTGWLGAADRPDVIHIRDGFRLVDRTGRSGSPHPMSDRNGDHVESRLQECSLYDPTLDLSIETESGDISGYSLYWFDPVTKVGLIEPVRVHDDFQRKGLARTMLTHGIDRLIAKGADRIKVSWETEAAGALYRSVGFNHYSTTTWFLNSKNQ